MSALRRLLSRNRRLALALLLCALGMKALVPAGYMLGQSGSSQISISLCADASGARRDIMLHVPGKPAGAKQGEAKATCAFAAAAPLGLSGADPLLLALALAAILALGLAPATALPFARNAHLRPPLRGPPAIA